jgi:hypothetical protein
MGTAPQPESQKKANQKAVPTPRGEVVGSEFGPTTIGNLKVEDSEPKV